MRVSETWLRSYVDPSVSTDELVAQLTMAGLEVDSVDPVAGDFSGVVVGHIVDIAPHPKADKLRVCQVAARSDETLTIVCGAPNAALGMKAPLALEGAELPGGMKIRNAELRGVASFGMLCSAKELGFEDGVAGLLALPEDAPVGMDIRQYLGLDDQVIEVDLTPNRADCLSVQGIAREVALLNGLEWVEPTPVAIDTTLFDTFPVTVDEPAACPRYLGRILKGFNGQAKTPLWMVERLRRSGVRSLGPIVDVTNYVLLEMGQPLHAFDLAKLSGGIRVRYAKAGEQLDLLNDRCVELESDMLVIADEAKALALAGVMGGSESAVGEGTDTVFLECAYFTPEIIMGRARRLGLTTDSSHRFERGVDPSMQERALERATELLLEIVGGEVGPVVAAVSENHLPVRAPIQLRVAKVAGYLGVEIPRERIEQILRSLGMVAEATEAGWKVTPPGFRFDIAIEVDLIEEIGRVYGYNNLPKRSPLALLGLQPASEYRVDLDRIKDMLVDRGYQEVITYSFVDAKDQERLDPHSEGIPLLNPISADMGMMRTGLWCGLIGAAINNVNRQQGRVRIFESGLRFARVDGVIRQEKSIAGLAYGEAEPEQWGGKSRKVDFYDVKADLEAILRHCGKDGSVTFAPGRHHALHPGQTAELLLDRRHVGWLGMLHPQQEKDFGFEGSVFVFELDQDALFERGIARFQPLSKFPQVRRDIAVLVRQETRVADLIAGIRKASSAIVRDVLVFDVYQGEHIEAGSKSVALGLILQDDAETLTDAQVDATIEAVVAALGQDFNAKLRD
jgi:phenylalanyl-tRNA synthetase beta chain